VGDHIAYRYEIIERINHGSFGEVYKVYDYKTREFQALKVVKKKPDLVKQTFIEVSILTHIKEKDKGDISGIVRLKDFTLFREHIVRYRLSF
jgi:serine/threonine protein kinase